jgi:hypothetical protein
MRPISASCFATRPATRSRITGSSIDAAALRPEMAPRSDEIAPRSELT